MKNKKLNLEELQVNSFVTSLDSNEKNTIDGGTSLPLISAGLLATARVCLPVSLRFCVATAGLASQLICTAELFCPPKIQAAPALPDTVYAQ